LQQKLGLVLVFFNT